MKKTFMLVVAVFVSILFVSSLALSGDSGKAIYGKNCVACHLANGKGNTKISKRITDFTKGFKWTKTDAQRLALIQKGKAPMPAYAKKLTASQQKAVLSYVKSFKKKK